jgi:hypothetical protein
LLLLVGGVGDNDAVCSQFPRHTRRAGCLILLVREAQLTLAGGPLNRFLLIVVGIAVPLGLIGQGLGMRRAAAILWAIVTGLTLLPLAYTGSTPSAACTTLRKTRRTLR